MLALVDPAAPHADHVHVGLSRGAQVARIVVAREARDETVRRYPVRALGEDRAAVDDELECFAPFVGMAVEHDGTQADPARPGADYATGAIDDFKGDRVERLGTVVVGPPEVGIFDFGFSIFDCGDDAAVAGDGAANARGVVGAGELGAEREGHASAP